MFNHYTYLGVLWFGFVFLHTDPINNAGSALNFLMGFLTVPTLPSAEYKAIYFILNAVKKKFFK